MNTTDDYKLISACDALIERRQFEEAIQLLEKAEGIVSTWLKGKVYLSFAMAMGGDLMFQEYGSLDMKARYRNILNEAYNHLYATVMCLSEASLDIREYLNQCLWRQLGQTENELARTKYWLQQEGEEDESQEEEDKNWAPDPDNLIDYISEMKL